MLNQDLVLKHNELYLVGEDQTDGSRERATGLYVRDTRFLDHWRLRLDGAPLEPLEARVLGADRAVVVAGNATISADGPAGREPVLPLTIAVEQSDAFDAVSRMYAYVYQRPLHFACYGLIIAALAVIGSVGVHLFLESTITLADWAVGWVCTSAKLGPTAPP